ncbi:MAG: hypothetical protein ACOYJY_06905 [Acutalibacteraceae bacterium]|jgi:hypothetical protein
MIVLYVLLAILGSVLLLLLIPTGAGAKYDGELIAWVRYGLIKIRLYPRKEKTPKPEKPPKKPKKPKPKKEKPPGKFAQIAENLKRDSPGETLRLAGELLRLVTKTAKRLLRAITVDRLELDLLVVAGEADATAVRYGQACAVLYPAMTTLTQTMRVKRHRLTVTPGFGREKGAVVADVRVHVIPLRIVAIALAAMFGFVKITSEDKSISTGKDEQHGRKGAESARSVDGKDQGNGGR